MKIEIRAPIVLRFQSPAAREGVYLLVTAVRSALISAFVFVAYMSPFSYLQWLRGPIVFAARVLGLPILALGKLLPPVASPILPVRGELMGSQWLVFWHHMVPGVIAYMLIFHVPVFVRLFRGRRNQDASAAA